MITLLFSCKDADGLEAAKNSLTLMFGLSMQLGQAMGKNFSDEKEEPVLKLNHLSRDEVPFMIKHIHEIIGVEYFLVIEPAKGTKVMNRNCAIVKSLGTMTEVGRDEALRHGAYTRFHDKYFIAYEEVRL